MRHVLCGRVLVAKPMILGLVAGEMLLAWDRLVKICLVVQAYLRSRSGTQSGAMPKPAIGERARDGHWRQK